MKYLVFKRADRKYYEMQWADAITGRLKTRSLKSIHKRDAERAAAAYAADLTAGLRREKVTWTEFRAFFEAEHFPDLRPASRSKYQTTMRLVETVISPNLLSSLREDEAAHIVMALRRRAVSMATIKGHIVHLKSMLKWAVDRRLLEAMPNIKPPRVKGQMKGRPITDEEFDRMLAAVPKVVSVDQVATWTEFLRGLDWSGLRLAEAMHLSWTDARDIRVELNDEFAWYRIQPHAEKAGQGRLTPVAPEFEAWLRTVPADRRRGRVFRLPTKDGAAMSIKDVSLEICRIGQAAGIKVADGKKPKFASAHDLRRRFGLRWAMRVMPPVLMALMRHESVQTTMQFYVGNAAEDAARAAMQAFTNTFTNKTGFSETLAKPSKPESVPAERVTKYALEDSNL